jgi:hypothetical protein
MKDTPFWRACVLAYPASIIGIAQLPFAAGCGSGAGADAGVDAAVADARTDATSGLLWSFGGGDLDVVAVVESRAGTLYAGACERGDGSSAATCFVVALDAAGHEQWRTALPQPGLVGLVASGTGDVWAQGESLTRIGASGAAAWAAPSALAWAGTAVALAPDGAYLQYTQGPGSQLAVQAIGSGGAVRWSLPIGGHTISGDNTPPTSLGPPAIDSTGYLEVPCRPCEDGRTGIAQVDLATGAVRSVAVVPGGDAGPGLPADKVTCDDQGNSYFGAGPLGAPVLASVKPDGSPRWTSAVARAPALIGSSSVVASSVMAGHIAVVALSPADGSLLGTTPAPDTNDLVGLVAGGLRMTTASFPVDGSSFVTMTGTAIADGSGHTVWSDGTMDPSTAIPAMGRVYGIERSGSGGGALVAVKAAITGVEQGAWPLLRHDPGRTGSAAGSW